LLKKLLGVSTVMLLKKPLFTEKAMPPPPERMAEAPSRTVEASEPLSRTDLEGLKKLRVSPL